MPADHSEKAFEAAIEDHLLTQGGYIKGDPANFDRERALDPTVLIPFIQETQPEAWEALEKIHGTETAEVLLDDLCKTMDSQGSLNVIRHGFKCFGKAFRVAYFAPAHGMNPDTQRLYAANRLTVTRQVHYSSAHENSLDLVVGKINLVEKIADLATRPAPGGWEYSQLTAGDKVRVQHLYLGATSGGWITPTCCTTT